jgi:hypothetical protein
LLSQIGRRREDSSGHSAMFLVYITTHKDIQRETLTEQALAFNRLHIPLLRHFRCQPQVKPRDPPAHVGRMARSDFVSIDFGVGGPAHAGPLPGQA